MAERSPTSARRVVIATALAMIAFASNSILCRLALGGSHIDAASFTTVRILSGAATLALLAALRRRANREQHPTRAGWTSAAFLYLYAIAFSASYVSLGAGTGALILFGCVQTTMLVAALQSGERPHRLEWLGLAVAMTGLVYLVLPGLEAPPFLGAILMGTAGVAWGLYSLRGRGSLDPFADTARNFACAAPFAIVTSVAAWSRVRATPEGIVLAVISGAVSSGLGYVIWYAALRGLTATRAATVQLSVPVIAAVGGVLLIGEVISLRLVAAAVMILGGVAVALSARRR